VCVCVREREREIIKVQTFKPVQVCSKWVQGHACVCAHACKRERDIITVQTFEPVQVCSKHKTSTVHTVHNLKPSIFPNKSKRK
jgi:hypothetical protein